MTPTQASPTYVTGVSLYFADRGARMSVPIAAAAELATDTTLILGAMRPGYLGREVLSVETLERWAAENEAAAEWAYVAACQAPDRGDA